MELFAELPAELRTRVYELYFEQQRDVYVPAIHDYALEIGPWYDRQPPVTRVSRQIRAESLPTFYLFCRFHVWDICGRCRPTQAKMVERQTKPGPSSVCQCIPHCCYRRAVCEWEYVIRNAWKWIHAIGDHNLAYIKTMTLSQSGNSLCGHVGYEIVIHQDPQTKRLTISDESFWQNDKRRFPCKVKASDPQGKAIIEDLMCFLKRKISTQSGLSATSIELICKHADAYSWRFKRGPVDMDAWMSRGPS